MRSKNIHSIAFCDRNYERNTRIILIMKTKKTLSKSPSNLFRKNENSQAFFFIKPTQFIQSRSVRVKLKYFFFYSISHFDKTFTCETSEYNLGPSVILVSFSRNPNENMRNSSEGKFDIGKYP